MFQTRRRRRVLRAAAGCAALSAAAWGAEDLPPRDLRGREVATLDTPRVFPAIGRRAEWRVRAQDLREQILVSAGLWPMPPRPPVEAQISGRTEHGDFSVEKVLIETHPGFRLAGNLYRPLGRGRGPFPGVLNPHGHWGRGRFEDGEQGSVVARCIHFARMGMIAFAYDMAGYNDTQFGGFPHAVGGASHRLFATNRVDLLWGVSLMGLQTWHSLRALDFLAGLPDVDRRRLACTGASGGGTQTFILGAIDDRLAAQAPTVMVSHSMQGGCLCENMPGLRIEHSNMEYAAAPAPRPQVCVAATGDWTRTFLTVEGPAMDSIYRLFGAGDRLRYEVLPYGHNYNRTTREAVYASLGPWLLRRPDPALFHEAPYPAATGLSLRVFADDRTPSDALTIDALCAHMRDDARARWTSALPRDRRSLARFRETFMPAWRHTLQVEFPVARVLCATGAVARAGEAERLDLAIGRPGRGDRVPAILWRPAGKAPRRCAVLVHVSGSPAFSDADGAPTGLAKALVDRGFAVLAPDVYETGRAADPARKAPDYFTKFFTTYNRTEAQERAQDLLTACAFARSVPGVRTIALCGSGRAGLWAMLAAPGADLVAADAAGFDSGSDEAHLASDLFVPGLPRIGGFAGCALLAAPDPLLVHGVGSIFATRDLEAVYAAARGRVRIEPGVVNDMEIADWIAGEEDPK